MILTSSPKFVYAVDYKLEILIITTGETKGVGDDKVSREGPPWQKHAAAVGLSLIHI